MSRAETLAGLTEAIERELAKHCCEYEHCGHCGEVDDLAAHQAAHVAAVALAWLEGQGWAEGDVQDVHLPRIPHSTRTLRGVTTPVETGEAP